MEQFSDVARTARDLGAVSKQFTQQGRPLVVREDQTGKVQANSRRLGRGERMGFLGFGNPRPVKRPFELQDLSRVIANDSSDP
jgi:hypothetical protein